MRNIILFGCCFLLSQISIAQLSTKDIIHKSIQYHDPEDLLKKGRVTLNLSETRPGRSDRASQVVMDQQLEYYSISRKMDGTMTEMILDRGKPGFSLNGVSDIRDEDIKEHRLTSDRLQSMKNYYRYLWLAPITLLDFFGKNCIEIKITYDPEVGHDIWYFYFNPKTYALEGYRFYHDQAANDGEYILLSETTKYKSSRIPKIRKWYMHQDDKYLGADLLEELYIK